MLPGRAIDLPSGHLVELPTVRKSTEISSYWLVAKTAIQLTDVRRYGRRGELDRTILKAMESIRGDWKRTFEVSHRFGSLNNEY